MFAFHFGARFHFGASAMGKNDTTAEERLAVVLFLYERACEGKLKTGAIGAAAAHFALHRNSVSTYWKRRHDLNGKEKGIVGRKKVYATEDLENKVKKVPAHKRQTLASTAREIGTPTSTVWRMLHSNVITRRNTSIKPMLSNDAMRTRLQFILSFVVPGKI